MGLHVAQMTGAGRDARSASTPSRATPARILGLEGYGLAPGCHADFVLLQARDPIEAIRLRATRLAVVRAGRVIARTPEATATLDLPGTAGDDRLSARDGKQLRSHRVRRVTNCRRLA